MFPLMFAAIAGGLCTAAAVAPASVALAVVSAPFGGSFAALAVAICLARRNGGAEAGRPVLADRTDAMVAALRSLEVHDRAKARPVAAEPGADRHVA